MLALGSLNPAVKPNNLLKVVYHPVHCMLHLHTHVDTWWHTWWHKPSSYPCKTIKEIETLYKFELKGVTYWLNTNKLTLNVDKSNLILLRRPRKKVVEIRILIKIDNKQIKEKEYTKYLAVLLDNQLSWGNHIRHLNLINLKLTRGIGILTELRKFVSKVILKWLYFAFVQSHIDYGLILWGTAMNATTKKME